MALERNLPGKTLDEIMHELTAGEVDMSAPLGDMQTLPATGPEVDATVNPEDSWVEIITEVAEDQ